MSTRAQAVGVALLALFVGWDLRGLVQSIHDADGFTVMLVFVTLPMVALLVAAVWSLPGAKRAQQEDQPCES